MEPDRFTAVIGCGHSLLFCAHTMSELQFDVFLSHNSVDKPEVAKLAMKLREAGLNPWLDAWHLIAGEPWLPAIERALQNSRTCAVVVGLHGLGNVHEDEMWLALQRGIESKRGMQRFRVIPVLLPNATRGDRAKLPTFLTANTWVELPPSLDDPAALDKLVKAIRGEPPGARPPRSKGECPYRGLAHFDIQHAPLFFGREALTDWLLSRLRGTASKEGPTRFLAIVGASGSGKSSLARAGLLAQLRKGELPGSERWPLVICRPENRPLESLATELANTLGIALGTGLKADLIERLEASLLASPERLHRVTQGGLPANDPDWRLVVLVDQFEELFTLNRAQKRSGGASGSAGDGVSAGVLSADRVAFFQNLLHAAMIENGRTIVILTMRGDFYGKCAAYPDLAAAVSQHQELVGPMQVDELRRAIEAPAQLSGSDIEPGLVDLLAREVAEQPGALPLLQYALAELWKNSRDRGENRLTTSAYRDLGGWEGALSRRADAVFAEFKGTPREQLCRQLFLRLVQPGEGTEDTKRLARWNELQRAGAKEAADLEQIVRTLADPDHRLITTSGDELSRDSTVEVIHEALIHGWGALRHWLDADRAGLRIHRRLTEAAVEWDRSRASESARDSGLLFNGKRLAEADEWARQNTEALNDLERSFLVASLRARRRRVYGIGAASAALLMLALIGALIWVNKQSGLRAEGLVETLVGAETGQVPALLEKLDEFRRWANPILQNKFDSGSPDSVQKLHAALALLPVDDRKADYLREQLLRVKPSQFPVVCDALTPHRAAIVEPLWSAALAGQGDTRERFQAACALAAYAPADERWDRIDAQVAARLVTLETSELVAWRKALQPAARQLLTPLTAIYRSPTEREQARTYAAETLAEYAADDVPTLLGLLADAEPFQFPLIYSRLRDRREQFVALGQAELQKEPVAEASETERERLARRQANVAVALLKLGAAEPAWPLLRLSPDPRSRSYLIHWLVPLGGDPQPLIRRFDEEPDVTIRRALLLALGEFSEAQLPRTAREALIEKLLLLFENDPDAGLHGAAEWLLRRWEQTEQLKTVTQRLRANEEQLRARPASDKRQWYINTQGQTFVVLEAREFRMGSPESDPERLPDEIPHQRRIGRTIAISAKEVTRDEFQRFLDDDANRDLERYNIDQYSRTDDSPQVSVSWYEAARYCNWLSKVEGIADGQWCYEPNEQGKYEDGMRPAADFLKRVGYRLATEAEWEFACRAGTTSSRYYGADTALLPKYAWALENSPGNHTRPTGRLKPNDLGLSDMLGNALEWCHDAYRSGYPIDGAGTAEDDVAALGVVKEIESRVLRGGSHSLPASRVRSAYRLDIRPGAVSNLVGFRPIRTYR